MTKDGASRRRAIPGIADRFVRSKCGAVERCQLDETLSEINGKTEDHLTRLMAGKKSIFVKKIGDVTKLEYSNDPAGL